MQKFFKITINLICIVIFLTYFYVMLTDTFNNSYSYSKFYWVPNFENETEINFDIFNDKNNSISLDFDSKSSRIGHQLVDLITQYDGFLMDINILLKNIQMNQNETNDYIYRVMNETKTNDSVTRITAFGVQSFFMKEIYYVIKIVLKMFLNYNSPLFYYRICLKSKMKQIVSLYNCSIVPIQFTVQNRFQFILKLINIL
jgi:hypothetical protein